MICGCVLFLASPAFAQALPRIGALYPAGARAGQAVEVSIRGGGLEGAREILVEGPGVTAKLNALDLKVDPADQKLFAAKCSLCHDLRGPSTLSRTAAQWVATVDRMIKDRGAPIEAPERQRIINYVSAAARAGAGLTARVTVAPDARPGRRELRVVGATGTSTTFPFEVGAQPEALEAEPNNEVAKAPEVQFPVTVNGQLARGDADCFKFQAKKDERLVFDCEAYRLNETSQAFFFPVLYLYDEKGKELVRNTGYFSLDPLIDWTVPADGKYVILIRDMLYRGSPSTVYRLSMGALPYKTYLFPAGGRRGDTTPAFVYGENMRPAALPVSLPAEAAEGIRQVNTGCGSFPFVVGDYPEYVEKPGPEPDSVSLPVSLNGRVEQPGRPGRYRFTLPGEKLGAYAFEAYAERIGSPLAAVLTLKDSKGRVLASSRTRRRNIRDPQIEYTFKDAGEYLLEVADAVDHAGPEYVYRVSAGPARPDFVLTISPDNPNLGPGSSVCLQLRVRDRAGAAGDIEVRFTGLPEGVTAGHAVIHPNESQSFVILTAAPDARPGAFTRVRAVGRMTVNGQAVEREAIPQEIYLINNNQQPADRRSMVVTVGPPAPWTVSIEPGAMEMSAASRPITVTVRLKRNGVQSEIPFAIVGLPPGVQAPRSLLFRRGQTELSFTMAPTSTGVFARGGPFKLAVVNGREGQGMQMSSAAAPVVLRK